MQVRLQCLLPVPPLLVPSRVSSNVAPSGLPATCFEMPNTRQYARKTSGYAPRTGRAASPVARLTAQRSVRPSLRVQKDRAASVQHAHAGKSVSPRLRARIGPRDEPNARARNPGQDTKCTLRSRSRRPAPNCVLQCSAITADLFLCFAGSELATMHTKCRVRQGPRAATFRQTTIRLHFRAQLAQSTSKSLSQNIVGKKTK